MVFLLSENRKNDVYVLILILIVLITITPILCNNINGVVLVKDIVTDSFFNEVANRADIVTKCKGKFNRSAFLQALDSSFSQFGTVGSKDDSAREIAAFFAHVTHDAADICSDDDQVGGLVEESNRICDRENEGYPCNPNGDGPHWISSPPSSPIPSSSLNNHDTSDQSIEINTSNINININEVQHRSSSVILFNRLLGFWMNNNCHNAITSGQGFGATIRAITTNTSGECDGLNPTAIISRVQLYTNYCNIFRVHPGKNLTC